jgi:hypothetical protein
MKIAWLPEKLACMSTPSKRLPLLLLYTHVMRILYAMTSMTKST